MTEYVKCCNCQGTGKVEFNGVFADTLAFLRAESEPINGADLARRHGVKVTAMCNRLVWLEKYGFAKRTRYGRTSLWRAIGAAPGNKPRSRNETRA